MSRRFWTCLVLSLGLAFAGALAQEATVPIPWKTADYTLLAREMSLRQALTSFGTSQGLAVVMSEAVEGSLSGDFRHLSPQEFLDKVTVLYNLTWYYDGTTLYIYNGAEVQTLLIDLKYMKAGEVGEMLKDLGVEDSRFPIKTTSKDELIMVAGPPRYVSLIAELVAKADKLREKRAYSEIETRIFYLKHTWADDVSLSVSSAESSSSIKGVAKMLEDIVTGGGNTPIRDRGLKGGKEGEKDDGERDVLADTMDNGVRPIIKAENRLNAVVVRDVSSRMHLYEELIAELDVPLKLVEVAVTVLEMNQDDALDWQLSLSLRGNTSNMDAGVGQNAGSLFGVEDMAGKGLTGALSYIGKHVSVAASLSAMRQKGKARSISRTSILTMNNMAASIEDKQTYHAKVVGKEVATLESVSAGTSLKLKPRIVFSETPGVPNQLWMTLVLDDGGFESVTVDSMPLTRTTSLQTQAAVIEGECILLAGYLRDIEQKVAWGIPWLRDIPYIGWLFGGVGKKEETVQRMFILTPYIIELDVTDLARIQATRQRDIRTEEQLEADKKDDDATRELRDLERKDRDEEREQRHADQLERRKGELRLRRQRREAERQESRQNWQEDLNLRQEQFKQEQKKAKESK
ncbi:MAG: type III secretion system outer membrane ring subunit SctC [Victivallales bacterium]|nr:type III secretion system outer membrane ring subunit SctC [Victivallales bacterium]